MPNTDGDATVTNVYCMVCRYMRVLLGFFRQGKLEFVCTHVRCTGDTSLSVYMLRTNNYVRIASMSVSYDRIYLKRAYVRASK